MLYVAPMANTLWVSDREAGVRQLFAELLPQAEILTPDELTSRLMAGRRPDALVIDGTQLLELPSAERASLLALPRLLICTGILLASMPMNITSGRGVAVLAKPFRIEDLEVAIEWLRGVPTTSAAPLSPFAAIVQRRRTRPLRGRLPAH